jgi:hypothetical protein
VHAWGFNSLLRHVLAIGSLCISAHGRGGAVVSKSSLMLNQYGGLKPEREAAPRVSPTP